MNQHLVWRFCYTCEKKSIKIILANPELFQALKLAEKQQESMRTSDVSVCIGRALIYGVIQMTASFKST